VVDKSAVKKLGFSKNKIVDFWSLWKCQISAISMKADSRSSLCVYSQINSLSYAENRVQLSPTSSEKNYIFTVHLLISKTVHVVEILYLYSASSRSNKVPTCTGDGSQWKRPRLKTSSLSYNENVLARGVKSIQPEHRWLARMRISELHDIQKHSIINIDTRFWKLL